MNTDVHETATELEPAETELYSDEIRQRHVLENRDTSERLGVAKDPHLSLELQSLAQRDEDECVLSALAGNTALFDVIQHELASSGTPAVRQALAANPYLNAKEQNYLALTGSDEVKCALAKNPSLVVPLQSLLACDAAPGVREALAENRALDPSSQEKLTQDGDEYTQQHIHTLLPLACNPVLTLALQEKLAEDDRVVASLARNPALSEAFMQRFAEREEEEIRAGLASNPSLPEALQARLIAGSSNGVRENMARNPSLTIAQQAQLGHDGNVDVRLALLENPSLSDRIRLRITTSFTRGDLSSAGNDLEYAEKKSMRLYAEYGDALDKSIRAYGGIFPSSEEKIDRLSKAADRKQVRIGEVDREINALEEKCKKLRKLLG